MEREKQKLIARLIKATTQDQKKVMVKLLDEILQQYPLNFSLEQFKMAHQFSYGMIYGCVKLLYVIGVFYYTSGGRNGIYITIDNLDYYKEVMEQIKQAYEGNSQNSS